MKEFSKELWDEISDLWEDFLEHFLKIKPTHPPKKKAVLIHGVLTTVRPAYILSERIDNILKFVFALSIIVSALTATFVGFIKLSDLLELLINTTAGRFLMFFIGISYLISSAYKLIHLPEKPR
jgi:hypothetical protein